MDMSELYFNANEQLRLDNLIPITKEVYKKVPKGYWDEQYKGLSYEKWKTLLKEQGYDVKRIKKNTNLKTTRQFFYVGDYYTVEINSLDPAWLLNEFTITCLEADAKQKESFFNKEYTLFFFPEWNLFAIDYFLRLYKQIDEEQLWQVFKDMYTHANYGFEMFPQEVLEEIFSHADNTSVLAVLKEKGAIDSEGYLTVYRGEGERSTDVEKAYSWTLSLDIATKFANHFGRGRIYKARVKAENIVDYYDERDEEEILVRYKYIEDLEYLKDY